MRFFTTVLPIALIAGANAIKPEAFRETEAGFEVLADQCSDDYWTCITSCPLLAPGPFCATWPLTCAIIYC
ncbi:hypothetical protein BJY04DRAFT_200470 [Aspergillus karnatakaensis]|uniref:uncharacterized protein n=1 Tax=Aspergillus karnatakaensis TaxID=1810916 RepID=UPI003CCE1E2B